MHDNVQFSNTASCTHYATAGNADTMQFDWVVCLLAQGGWQSGRQVVQPRVHHSLAAVPGHVCRLVERAHAAHAAAAENRKTCVVSGGGQGELGQARWLHAVCSAAKPLHPSPNPVHVHVQIKPAVSATRLWNTPSSTTCCAPSSSALRTAGIAHAAGTVGGQSVAGCDTATGKQACAAQLFPAAAFLYQCMCTAFNTAPQLVLQHFQQSHLPSGTTASPTMRCPSPHTCS